MGAVTAATAAKPIYMPQSCRLCDKPTIYVTRSGLSDHATMHHAHWYSAKRDEYVAIPEANLEAKRSLIRRNQAHRKFRRDPVDSEGNPAGKGKQAPTGSRATGESKHGGGTKHPRSRRRSAGGYDPPTASTPTTREDARTVLSRRRASC